METALLTPAQNDLKQVETFGDYTITKDFKFFVIKITRASARARFGMKLVAHYSFARRSDVSRSIFDMNQYVEKFKAEKLKQSQEKESMKLAVKDARKNFKHSYEVGQILYDSWGYDQTNIDFFQITAIKGLSVTLRKVAQNAYRTGHDCGKCSPIKDSFVGEEIKRRIVVHINYKHEVVSYIKDASNWDGTEKYWSDGR